MEVKTRTHVYIDCECGKALKHRVKDGFSEDYIVIVEPCSCLIEKQLMKEYGLKTAEEIYELGVEDGKIALEYGLKRR